MAIGDRDPRDDGQRSRQPKNLDEAVRETQEPIEAKVMRAQDDARTDAILDATAADARNAERQLRESRERLEETAADLKERVGDLSETRKLAKDVLKGAEELKRQAQQMLDSIRDAK